MIYGCKVVNVSSLFFGFIRSKRLTLAIEINESPKFLPTSADASVLDAAVRALPGPWALIGSLLRACSQPQVGPFVVLCIPVNVVNA